MEEDNYEEPLREIGERELKTESTNHFFMKT